MSPPHPCLCCCYPYVPPHRPSQPTACWTPGPTAPRTRAGPPSACSGATGAAAAWQVGQALWSRWGRWGRRCCPPSAYSGVTGAGGAGWATGAAAAWQVGQGLLVLAGGGGALSTAGLEVPSPPGVPTHPPTSDTHWSPVACRDSVKSAGICRAPVGVPAKVDGSRALTCPPPCLPCPPLPVRNKGFIERMEKMGLGIGERLAGGTPAGAEPWPLPSSWYSGCGSRLTAGNRPQPSLSAAPHSPTGLRPPPPSQDGPGVCRPPNILHATLDPGA